MQLSRPGAVNHLPGDGIVAAKVISFLFYRHLSDQCLLPYIYYMQAWQPFGQSAKRRAGAPDSFSGPIAPALRIQEAETGPDFH